MADLCSAHVFEGSEDNESFHDVGEVVRHVWDMALGEVGFCGGVQHYAELRFTRDSGEM